MREECSKDFVSLDAVKITAIHANSGSQYLKNVRAFGTPDKIGFSPAEQSECN
jgi:hypothetical protein